MVFASVDTVFQNATPTLFDKKGERAESTHDWDEDVRKGSIQWSFCDMVRHRVIEMTIRQPIKRDAFDAREIFDLIREIRDPEHPMSLEELG